MTNSETTVGNAFLELSRQKLLEDYWPKIRKCLDVLSDGDVWWRAHETNNSIGNLILHLSGNIQQWIVSGIGGKENARNRPAEFAARESRSKKELLETLELALHEVDGVLVHFDVARLFERRAIQGFEVTCLEAIFHVVEHFSGHTAQIIFITKLKSGKDLMFYNL